MTAPSNPALLPCPFCGAAAEVIHDQSSDYSNHWDYSVSCTDRDNCWIQGYSSKDREKAVQHWNTRTPAVASEDAFAASGKPMPVVADRNLDHLLQSTKMVASVQHWSDCAVHNEPAYPNGPCDCGGFNGADSGIEEPCPVSAGESASLSPTASVELEKYKALNETLYKEISDIGQRAKDLRSKTGFDEIWDIVVMCTRALNENYAELQSHRTQPAITDAGLLRARDVIVENTILDFGNSLKLAKAVIEAAWGLK